MTKYGLHGQLRAKPGQGEQLIHILLEAARLMNDVEGCHLYLVSNTEEDPDGIWVTEVWNSREDHDRSLENEQVHALIARAMPLLAGRPKGGQVMRVWGGAGLE